MKRADPSLSARSAAKKLNVSPSTITNWWAEEEQEEQQLEEDLQAGTVTEGKVAALALEKAHEILALLPNGVPGTSVDKAAVAVARLIEKYLALTGRPIPEDGDGPDEGDPALRAFVEQMFQPKSDPDGSTGQAPGS